MGKLLKERLPRCQSWACLGTGTSHTITPGGAYFIRYEGRWLPVCQDAFRRWHRVPASPQARVIRNSLPASSRTNRALWRVPPAVSSTKPHTRMTKQQAMPLPSAQTRTERIGHELLA